VEAGEKERQIVVGPRELYTTYVAPSGVQVTFRPVHPTDEPRVRHLFYQLSQQTVYYRFMSMLKRLPRKQIRDFVFVDHRSEVAIVGTVPEAHGEEIIAVGRYWLDPKTNRAEIAFTVQDNWQKQGIGTFLFRYLTRTARRSGIRGFSAEVLAENKPMQKVFNKSNLKTQCKLSGGVYSYLMDFD
jgi:GNAT superfamily N-acetyltransferase